MYNFGGYFGWSICYTEPGPDKFKLCKMMWDNLHKHETLEASECVFGKVLLTMSNDLQMQGLLYQGVRVWEDFRVWFPGFTIKLNRLQSLYLIMIQAIEKEQQHPFREQIIVLSLIISTCCILSNKRKRDKTYGVQMLSQILANNICLTNSYLAITWVGYKYFRSLTH